LPEKQIKVLYRFFLPASDASVLEQNVDRVDVEQNGVYERMRYRGWGNEQNEEEK